MDKGSLWATVHGVAESDMQRAHTEAIFRQKPLNILMLRLFQLQDKVANLIN